MEHMPQISMTNKVKENIGFHYSFTEIRLHNLILLEPNIFRKTYKTKSKTNLSHTTYLEDKMMNLLCVDIFVVSLSYNI